MSSSPSPQRDIHHLPGVGMAARVVQARRLELLRIHVEQPALILVDKGIKTVQPEKGASVRAKPAQAIALTGGQRVDFTNAVPDGEHYEARWLVFDNALLDDAYYRSQAAQIEAGPARLITAIPPGLAEAFSRATQSLAPASGIPESVARQRMLEVLHWLLQQGIAMRSISPSLAIAAQVRAMVATGLDTDWTASRVAGELALSQATLRRRLAAEGQSFSTLLVDARMAAALTLLQATSHPVGQIAVTVGYASPSRFAVRFRQRFGFAPSAVRERLHP
jgi:AraC-like DNA-binding protein